MRRPHRLHLAASCAALLLAACKREPARERAAPAAEAARPAAQAASGETVVLATVGEADKAPAAPVAAGLGMHPTTPAGSYEFIFAERGGGVAWALEDAPGRLQVAYNGRPGKVYRALQAIVLGGPDGRRCAYGALDADGKWREVVDGVEGPPFASVRRAVFSADGAHVAYQAMRGERWHLVVDGVANAGTATRILAHDFDAGATRVVYVDDVDDHSGEGKLVVSDLRFAHPVVVDRAVTRLVVGPDRTRVAAVTVSGGRQAVLTVALARPDLLARGPAYDEIERLAFGADGATVAYVAVRGGQRLLVLGGAEAPLPEGQVVGLPAVTVDGRGAGVLVASGGSVALWQLPAGAGPGGARYEEAEGLVYGPGGTHAYAARRGTSWFVVAGGREGPPFDRVVSPAFSADGRFLVYRARKDGKRFVVAADPSGRTLRQHPAYEQVFPVVFTPDGRAAAYGVKDGPRLAWKVEPL